MLKDFSNVYNKKGIRIKKTQLNTKLKSNLTLFKNDTNREGEENNNFFILFYLFIAIIKE
jgi:hypothetical protein